jgi:hypothetical protein
MKEMINAMVASILRDEPLVCIQEDSLEIVKNVTYMQQDKGSSLHL